MKLNSVPTQAHKLIMFYSTPRRYFAPPKPAGKSAGGPPAAPAAPPVEIMKAPFERLIENNQEFIFGPPPGINKVVGPHRDVLIPKLAGRMEIYAKKLRETYIREGIIPDDKIYIDTLRKREPEDTIEKCVTNKTIASVIEGREEFPELDLIFPWSVPHLIKRTIHNSVRPFYVRHEGEEIRVTVKQIDRHFKREYPFFMNL